MRTTESLSANRRGSCSVAELVLLAISNIIFAAESSHSMSFREVAGYLLFIKMDQDAEENMPTTSSLHGELHIEVGR